MPQGGAQCACVVNLGRCDVLLVCLSHTMIVWSAGGQLENDRKVIDNNNLLT